MGGRGAWSATASRESERLSRSVGGSGRPSEKLPSSMFQHLEGNRTSTTATARAVENSITQNSFETGVIIDTEGFVVAAYKGDSHSVGFSDGRGNDDYSKLAGSVMTHNHPSGSAAFSDADIMLASYYGVREIRAATRNNGTAVLTAVNHHADWRTLNRAYQRDYATSAMPTVRSAQQWMFDNASNFGFTFVIDRRQ